MVQITRNPLLTMSLMVLVLTGCSVKDARKDNASQGITSPERNLKPTEKQGGTPALKDDSWPPVPAGRVANEGIRKGANHMKQEGIIKIMMYGRNLNRCTITDTKEIEFIANALLSSSRKTGARRTGSDGDSSDTIQFDTAKNGEYQYRIDAPDVSRYWGPGMVKVYARYCRPEFRHWFTSEK